MPARNLYRLAYQEARVTHKTNANGACSFQHAQAVALDGEQWIIMAAYRAFCGRKDNARVNSRKR